MGRESHVKAATKAARVVTRAPGFRYSGTLPAEAFSRVVPLATVAALGGRYRTIRRVCVRALGLTPAPARKVTIEQSDRLAYAEEILRDLGRV